MAKAQNKSNSMQMTDAEQAELAKMLVEFRHSPYEFVMFAFPWGMPGTPLEFETGPDKWQRDSLIEIGSAIERNEKVQHAVASGKGIGKSCETAFLALWAIFTEVDTRGIITANTEAQIRTKTWPELSKWYYLLMPHLRAMFTLTATAIYSNEYGKDKTWRIDAATWSENNVEAFAGLHNKGRRIIVIFDEASKIADPVWDTTDGIMSDANTEVIWAVRGNPTQNTGRFRQCWGKLRSQWITRRIDSRTVKITDKAVLAAQVALYGEDSDYVRKYIKGQFPRAATGQFNSGELVELAMARDPVSYLYEPLLMGVDVARFGDDSTVISFRRGRDACSIPWVKMKGKDVTEVAAKVAELKREHFVDVIFVDGGGVGGGVVDILRKARHTVFDVQAGAGVDGSIKLTKPIKLLNKRAEMWAVGREWMENGALPDDDELEQDLIGIEYSFNSDDTLVLERKQDMKKRGLGSPDSADSLMLTFAFPVPDKVHTEIQQRLLPDHGGQTQGSEDYNPYA